MAAAEGARIPLSVEQTREHSAHPTTNRFWPSRARIAILGKCKQFSDDIQFNQVYGYPLHPIIFGRHGSFLVVQYIVAVKDEHSGELWACKTSSEVEQLYITGGGMFRIIPEVRPYAYIFSSKMDFKGQQLRDYEGNITFLLPVERDNPCYYMVGMQLCRSSNYGDEVLDERSWQIKSHERGTDPRDFQNGRTITEVEKPIPKIKIQGVLAGRTARVIRMHFQNLGDNGQYDQFLRDMQKLDASVGGKPRFNDLVLAVKLEEAIMNFGQNKMDDCLATCQYVCARATRHNSGNWPFLQAKAYYIISAVYRQAEDFDLANEYMEKSSECLEPACLNEETAVNRYNAAALLAERSAAVGLTSDEEHLAERLFEEVAGIWAEQKENESKRCVIRSMNRLIMFLLKTSRTKFPDLRKDVSEVRLAKASEVIKKCERNLLPQCPKRLKGTFLMGKADYFIRRATRKGPGITEQERREDLITATNVLEEAMDISRELRMQTEIDGIRDRMRTIQAIFANGFQWLNERAATVGVRNEPCQGNTNDLDDFLAVLLREEQERNRRRADQCTE
ncbi:uncharacterized protein [Montipora capricornis]|uniref:uncharacterized protein isoform X2 n=1 Tax=Montipora capricornis TaxID=246305 RepID=UPI0035F19E83